jgi:hypothetical protein
MARPLTRAQALENAAFLRALRRTGNVREAARACGVGYGTIQHRRRAHPSFAQRWDVALAFAHARLRAAGGRRGPSAGARDADDAALRTRGGEPVVVQLKSGRFQVRRAQPGKVTQQAEQAFLLALSATANIRLAAASVGVAEAAFFRRRNRNPAFAREWAAALAEGYARIEEALLAGWMPGSGEDDAWQRNEPPATPPMTPAQALQLLHLHHKDVHLRFAGFAHRLAPGEPSDWRTHRMRTHYRWRLAHETENEVAARVLRDEPGPARHEPPPIALPDLAQVTGWSRADPAKGGHGPAALFGGWRIEQMERRLEERAERLEEKAKRKGK